MLLSLLSVYNLLGGCIHFVLADSKYITNCLFLNIIKSSLHFFNTKEAQVNELLRQKEQEAQQANAEREDLIGRFKTELEELREDVGAVQKDRDEKLVDAENQKQEVRRDSIPGYIMKVKRQCKESCK